MTDLTLPPFSIVTYSQLAEDWYIQFYSCAELLADPSLFAAQVPRLDLS